MNYNRKRNNGIADLQYMASTNPDKKNTLMQMLRIFHSDNSNNMDMLFFEKKGNNWYLSQNNCFISLDSPYIDLYMSHIGFFENVTLEQIIVRLASFGIICSK